MKNEQEMLTEINQRVTRLESRLVQLGDYVGANLRTRMRITVDMGENDAWVEVDAYDVSISRIKTALREAGIKDEEVPVRLNGKTIAIVFAG